MASCFFIYKKSIYTYETKLANESKALVLSFIYLFIVLTCIGHISTTNLTNYFINQMLSVQKIIYIF